MAAHSGSSSIVAFVPPDQPPIAWHQWLREIAQSINLMSSWTSQPVLRGTLYAALPTAPEAGSLAFITDSTVATWGSTIAGGGANKVLAWHNGTNWRVIGI